MSALRFVDPTILSPAEAQQLYELLDDIEWRGGSCPDCGQLYRKVVHQPECRIGATLAAIREGFHDDS